MSAHAAVVLVLATTSKTPFYIAGGLLAVWAVVVSAIGISRPDFPGSSGARAVTMGISVVLVVAAMATAILTATFEHTEAAKAEGSNATGAPTNAPSPSSGGTSTTGGAASGGGGAVGPAVQIAADPSGNLRYQQKTVTASAGTVNINFTNKSPVPHNVTVVKGAGSPLGATQTITSGRAALKLQLKPGTYTFFCSVDGHRAAGMQGTLVVK
jgi:plastocyanin